MKLQYEEVFTNFYFIICKCVYGVGVSGKIHKINNLLLVFKAG